MIFNDNNYYSPMDREYADNDNSSITKKLEEPLFPVSQIGMTVTEGRAGGGTFIQSVTAAIRQGAGRLELSTMMEGSDQNVGAESYGKDAREAIRELAKINEVKLHSVHAPSQIGNVSGLGQQGFSDEQRNKTISEINKAIDFAKDVTNGASIVIHTGEFNRVMADQSWAQDKKGEQIFEAYEEEKEKAVIHIVDDRTGQIMQTVKKNQLVSRPVWNRFDPETNKEFWKDKGGKEYTDENGTKIKKGDYVDYEGNKVDLKNRVPVFITDTDDENYGRFKVEKQGWDNFVKEADEINAEFKSKHNRAPTWREETTPEEAFYKATLQIQEGTAKGWAMQYARDFEDELKSLKKLKELRIHYKKIDDATSPEDKWKLEQQIPSNRSRILPPETKSQLEVIDDEIRTMKKSIEYARQASASQEQQAQESQISQIHAQSIKKYALNKSFDTLAKTGLSAMSSTTEEQDRRKKAGIKDQMEDIFVAPENIFPEMGFGSHPEELIELVDGARKRMVELMTKQRIDGHKWDEKNEKWNQIDNPNYNKKYAQNKELARKVAENHIKATFDTQHLGMWRKHFKSKGGETQAQTDERFHGWYMDQVKKMDKAGIIGNIHIVDGWGYGHTHLPAGQGSIPVVDAVTYLKKKGYVGNMSSEGFGEPGRQLTETWRAFGANVYGGKDIGGWSSGGSQNWANIQHGYFGKAASPYFIFGAYSPNNDWTLWSQTPME